MRKRNLFTKVLVTIMATTMILSGCAGGKSETLVESESQTEESDSKLTLGQVLAQMSEIELTSGSFSLDARNSYKVKDGNSILNRRMYGDAEFLWSSEPSNLYRKESYRITQLNYNENKIEKLVDRENELYLISLNATNTDLLYMKQKDGNWYKTKATVTDEMTNLLMADLMLNESLLTEEQLNTTYEERIEKINYNKVYKFIVKANYEQAGSIVQSCMDSVLAEIEGLAMDVEWIFAIYIDTDTYYPVACKIKLKEEVDFSQTERTLWSEICEIDITYDSLNEVKVELPKTIKENAIDFGI